MYVHQPAPEIQAPTVRTWGTSGSVSIDLGTVVIIVQTAEEADALMIAVADAKKLLAPPVITDSERTCNEVNPDGSGEHCHRGGDHGVHRDSNGDEWRTDLASVTA